MSYITRDIEEVIKKASEQFSCVLVTGPRQVGKTTLLAHLAGTNRNYVSLDDVIERQFAKSNPEEFLSVHPFPLLIDEVQYAPELFSYIKIAIDNGAPRGSYWMTGSQSYSLMKLAGESLAGRICILNLPALSNHEISGSGKETPFVVDYNYLQERSSTRHKMGINEIYDRIYLGGMPRLVTEEDVSRDLYYSKYLTELFTYDILPDIKRDEEGNFINFLRAVACNCAQPVNVHSLAVDVGISDRTANAWLLLLEKYQVIYYLHPYSNNLLTRTIKYPKLYFFDTGLVSYLTKYNNKDVLMNGALSGQILENYVVNEVRKSYINSGITEPPLYYYRDKDQNEIDLVILDNDTIYPIEIKKTSNPLERMTKTIDKIHTIMNGSTKVGMGAIICNRDKISYLNENVLLIPFWAI